MTPWRIGPAVLAAAGMLLAAAPGQVQAAEQARPEAWVSGSFPEGNAMLRGAARVDADTTWAIGSRTFGEGRERYSDPVLLSRDDGTHAWRELPVPAGFDGLRTVTAGPAGTTWLTDGGSSDEGGIPTARQDGSGWRSERAPLPDGALGGGFSALAPVAEDDVWAVGWSQPADFLTFYGLIEHWDGTDWRQVETPVIDSDYWTLSDVVANGPDDVWATGSVGSPEGRIRPLMLHYDGEDWDRVATPEITGEYGEFVDLTTTGPDDVWAVGTAEIGASAKDHGMVAHFDGRRWTKVDTGAGPGRLESVTSTSSGVTAVGHSYADGVYRPLGVRQTHDGWKPLRVPAGPGAQGRVPTVVLGAGRSLTVVGFEPGDEAESGESLPPMPFAVTTG